MGVFRRAQRPTEEVHLQEIDERHELSQQIFILREDCGWTQEQLADRSGLTQSQVAKLEAGQANPTLRTLTKLAQAFNRRVFELLRWSESLHDEDASGACEEETNYEVSSGKHVITAWADPIWGEGEFALDTFLPANRAVVIEEQWLQHSFLAGIDLEVAPEPAQPQSMPAAKMPFIRHWSSKDPLEVSKSPRADAA